MHAHLAALKLWHMSVLRCRGTPVQLAKLLLACRMVAMASNVVSARVAAYRAACGAIVLHALLYTVVFSVHETRTRTRVIF